MNRHLAIGCLLVALLLAAAVAFAHGAPMWIQEGGYTDQDGVGCCGPTDCHREQAVKFREADDGRVRCAWSISNRAG